jgi:hypothetical protein
MKDEPKFTVEISVPESLYKQWGEYHSDGVAGVKMQLKKDFKDALARMWMSGCDVEITHEP